RRGQHVQPALAALSAGWHEKPEVRRGYAGDSSIGYAPYRPLYLLVEFDDDPSVVLPILADALKDSEEPVRLLEAINLPRWGERMPEAVRVMAEALRHDPVDGRTYLRMQAARSLGELGGAAVGAVAVLEAALSGLRSWELRAEVIRTIARLRIEA